MRYLGPILTLTFLIALHELGHVFAAALFRIKLERFALGLGPALLSARRRGTQVVLAAIPVGAFAELRGMNPHAASFDRSDPRSFASKGFWTRALVLLAGSLANVVFAYAVLVALYVKGTHVPVHLTLGTVAPASAAAQAQLRAGDVILAVDGHPLHRWSELADHVAGRSGRPLTARVARGEQTFEAQLVPRADEYGRGRLGITEQYVFRLYPFKQALSQAFGHMGSLLARCIQLVRRLAAENVTREVAQRISAASLIGLDAWLRAIAALSLVLGIFHLLPLPPLDGGRVSVMALERLSGKTVPPKLESLVHALGTIALVAGLGWLLARDVARIVIEARSPGPSSESTAKQEEGP